MTLSTFALLLVVSGTVGCLVGKLAPGLSGGCTSIIGSWLFLLLACIFTHNNYPASYMGTAWLLCTASTGFFVGRCLKAPKNCGTNCGCGRKSDQQS